MAQKKKARKTKSVKKKPVKKAPPKTSPKKAEKEKPKEIPKETRAENVVLIGRKPVMNYVVACITFFNTGEKEVSVKARGRAISTAVDTVELLRRAFVKDLEIKGINIDTEEMQQEEGGTRNVSTLEIIVAKTGSK
jgi:DNA-binding protein Alba